MIELEALRRENSHLLHRAVAAEEALAAFQRSDSQQLLRAIFDSALDAIVLADDRATYVDANPAACRLFGVSREELIGRRVAVFATAGAEAPTSFQRFRDVGHTVGVFPFVRPDGTTRVLEFSAVANVVPGRHLSILRDITERVAAVEALRRNEAMFRAMIEKSSEIISLTGPDGTTRYLTPSAWRFLGWDPAELESRTMRDQVIPEDRDRIAAELARLVRTGARDMAMELRVRHRDGSIRWVETTGTNLLDDPDVRAIVGNYRDITARKEADAALRESRDQLDEAQTLAHLGRWSAGIGPDDEITWSTECARIFGIAPNIPVTKTQFYAAIHPADRAQLGRAIAEMIASDQTYDVEHRVQWTDGTIRWVHSRAIVDRDSAGHTTRMHGTIQDVTDRHVAVEALQTSEERYRRIVENTAEGVWMYDAHRITTFMNPRMADMLGYALDELVGQPIFVMMDPSRHEAARARTERRMQGLSERSDFYMRHKNGTEILTSIQASPMYDADGRFECALALVRDVSGERRAEADRAQLADQLRQAQKMEAVGRLAGGVAHDFNNLLTVILSYTEFAIEDLRPGDPLRDSMIQIDQAGKRAAELTRQLLAFSRQQVLQPRVIDLNSVVLGMERMLRRLIGEDVALALHADPTLCLVRADPGQLEQVLMNLAVNARDAMPAGGSLELRTAVVRVGADRATGPAGIAPGDYVVLAVADTGIGMDAATCARIFEPFFTTKGLGKGTGLGLSTVFGIVQQSGGYVGVASVPGRGTTFEIYLPRTEAQVVGAELAQPIAQLRGTETILLVEDEEQVRTVACTILRRNGYTVLDASNGGEAFLASKGFAGPIHLLLTDVVMPRMSGPMLAAELALQRPTMKVLYASGYTDDAVLNHGVLGGAVEFVQKPFTPDALLRKVRDVLGASSAPS